MSTSDLGRLRVAIAEPPSSGSGITLDFVGRSGAKATAVRSDDGATQFLAPSRVFKFALFDALGEIVRRAICLEHRLDDKFVTLAVGFQVSATTYVSPMARLTSPANCDADRVRSIVMYLLDRLKSVDTKSLSLIDKAPPALGEQTLAEINAAADDLLLRVGDSSVSLPFDVRQGGSTFASLVGRFKSKPNRTDLTVHREVLTGHFDGFRSSKRCLYLLPTKGELAQIHWETDLEREQVLRLATSSSTRLQVDVTYTIGKSGDRIYRFVRAQSPSADCTNSDFNHNTFSLI